MPHCKKPFKWQASLDRHVEVSCSRLSRNTCGHCGIIGYKSMGWWEGYFRHHKTNDKHQKRSKLDSPGLKICGDGEYRCKQCKTLVAPLDYPVHVCGENVRNVSTEVPCSNFSPKRDYPSSEYCGGGQFLCRQCFEFVEPQEILSHDCCESRKASCTKYKSGANKAVSKDLETHKLLDTPRVEHGTKRLRNGELKEFARIASEAQASEDLQETMIRNLEGLEKSHSEVWQHGREDSEIEAELMQDPEAHIKEHPEGFPTEREDWERSEDFNIIEEETRNVGLVVEEHTDFSEKNQEDSDSDSDLELNDLDAFEKAHLEAFSVGQEYVDFEEGLMRDVVAKTGEHTDIFEEHREDSDTKSELSDLVEFIKKHPRWMRDRETYIKDHPEVSWTATL
ncbi:hypothetical protein B0J14DRAFT_565764 [Halenospora varia]|nr:hypothetical protein B0J14DRAFT_565764 [Halenospora varia]